MEADLTLMFFWERIETIAKDGATVIVKLDGQRNDNNVYTVILSGGKLGSDFFRKDGSELTSLLNELIQYYDGIVSIW